MTHEDRGHYAKKHPSDRKIKPEIANALKTQAVAGEISCIAAHQISDRLNATPDEIGFTMDMLEMRIAKCQMGLFGYKPQKKIVTPSTDVKEDLKNAIKEQLKNERLSCKAAWEIAARLNIKKMTVSSACETLKTKISPCQLGAF